MTPTITTRSLVLRRLAPDDAADLFALSQEPGMRAWIPDQVYADEQEARLVLAHLIAQYDNPAAPRAAPLVLGACLRSGGELIGHVGLSPARDRVEIGYAIGDAHQGRGLATEAVQAMAGWGLATFGLAEIVGIVASDNVASCRVLEKAGFALAGETTRSLHGAMRLVRTYVTLAGARSPA